MEKGTFIIFAGLPLILGGIFALKITGFDIAWAAIALGAVIAIYGGITLSMKAA